VSEVAGYLQLAEKTVRSKVSKGEIPRIPNIGEIRIPGSYIQNCEIGMYEKGTFAERRLKEIVSEKDQEIQELKSKIRRILKIGMEVDI